MPQSTKTHLTAGQEAGVVGRARPLGYARPAGEGWTGLALLGIVLIALLLRLAFFRGPFGSDDNVYLARALDIAEGVWKGSDYVGAIRYGFNIPAGFFVWLFGQTFFAGNLYSLLLSLGEVLLVGLLAWNTLGQRVGLTAAAMLAVTPLHVDRASVLHRDAPLAFFITLSFALFWFALKDRRPSLFFAAGIAIGMTYWIREVSVIFLFVFLFYALWARQWTWGYAYAALGGLLMLGLNCLLMWVVEGDALHVIAAVRSAVETGYIGQPRETSPVYYLRYFFISIQHTWLLGYLAVAGLVTIMARGQSLPDDERAFLTYIAVWLFGLLALFSLLPISFDPFTLIAKQSNYMNVFLAPMTLLAAFVVARLRFWAGALVLFLFASGALLLAALGQQDLRAFVANGKAIHRFAVEAEEGVDVYGTRRNVGLSVILKDASGGYGRPAPVKHVGELSADILSEDVRSVVIAVDPVTHHTSTEGFDRMALPACWQRLEVLQPRDFGLGQAITAALLWIAEITPAPLNYRVAPALRRLHSPEPATLYTAPVSDPWCGREPPP